MLAIRRCIKEVCGIVDGHEGSDELLAARRDANTSAGINTCPHIYAGWNHGSGDLRRSQIPIVAIRLQFQPLLTGRLFCFRFSAIRAKMRDMKSSALVQAMKKQASKGLLKRQTNKFASGTQANLGMMQPQMSGGGDMANPTAIAGAFGKMRGK